MLHGAYHAEQELKLGACHPVASYHNSFDLTHRTSLVYSSREHDQLPCWKIRSVRFPWLSTTGETLSPRVKLAEFNPGPRLNVGAPFALLLPPAKPFPLSLPWLESFIHP